MCAGSSAAAPHRLTGAPSRGHSPLARCLIVGCGCRGRALTRALCEQGHAVRGTTRDPARATEIEAAGAEPFVGDPDRVATLAPALDRVAVLCLLLGCAHGGRKQLEALHGPRLEMLLSRLIDTTVRGVVYEARGSVPGEILAAGAQRVRRDCERSRVPFALLDAAPAQHGAWLAAALAAVTTLVS